MNFSSFGRLDLGDDAFDFLNTNFISNEDASKHIISMDYFQSILAFITNDGSFHLFLELLICIKIPIKNKNPSGYTTNSNYQFAQICFFREKGNPPSRGNSFGFRKSNSRECLLCLLTKQGSLILAQIRNSSALRDEYRSSNRNKRYLDRYSEFSFRRPLIYVQCSNDCLFAINEDGIIHIIPNITSQTISGGQSSLDNIYFVELNDPVFDIGLTQNQAYALTIRGDVYTFLSYANKLSSKSKQNPFENINPEIKNAVKIDASAHTFVILTLDGTVYMGYDDENNLKNSRLFKFNTDSITKDNDTVVRKIIDVSAGKSHIALISSDGKIFTYGSNTDAQCLTGFDCCLQRLVSIEIPRENLDSRHCYRGRQVFCSENITFVFLQNCLIDESNLKLSKSHLTKSPIMLQHGGRNRFNINLQFVQDDVYSTSQPYFRKVIYVKSHEKKNEEMNFSKFENLFKDAVQKATIQSRINVGVGTQNDNEDPIQLILKSAYEEYVSRNYFPDQ